MYLRPHLLVCGTGTGLGWLLAEASSQGKCYFMVQMTMKEHAVTLSFVPSIAPALHPVFPVSPKSILLEN